MQALHCRRGEKVENLTHNHQRDLFKRDEMENLPLMAGTESASFSGALPCFPGSFDKLQPKSLTFLISRTDQFYR